MAAASASGFAALAARLRRLPWRQGLPCRADLLPAAAAAVLALGLLAALWVPALRTLQERARLAAVRGNAATLQLAAEFYAALHQGVYPATAADLVPLLPQGRPPRNPLTGRPCELQRRPGDVTYDATTGGRDYVIRAWGQGPGIQPQVLLTLAGARR